LIKESLPACLAHDNFGQRPLCAEADMQIRRVSGHWPAGVAGL